MEYQDIEKVIINSTKNFAKRYNIHYDEFTEQMIANAMNELNACLKIKPTNKDMEKPKKDGFYDNPKCKMSFTAWGEKVTIQKEYSDITMDEFARMCWHLASAAGFSEGTINEYFLEQ
jgi:hypothetical protein